MSYRSHGAPLEIPGIRSIKKEPLTFTLKYVFGGRLGVETTVMEGIADTIGFNVGPTALDGSLTRSRPLAPYTEGTPRSRQQGSRKTSHSTNLK